MHRQEQNRQCKETAKASETPEQILHRQEQNRLRKETARASETLEQTLHRQEHDRQHKETTRASETPEQILHRQEQNRLRKETARASETPEQTLNRLQQNRMQMEIARASETPGESFYRKQTIKKCASSRRKKSLSFENAISAFHSDIQRGPDFVCMGCHRMMYRKSVVQCKKSKYTKVSCDVLQKVFSTDFSYISNDGKEWIGKTCDRSLVRGSMPLQAKANGLEVPPELSGLNALELRLISLRVPFMKMVAIPSGKQRSIHGQAVNVPSKVDTICDVLPRLPSQSELVPLTLKRKVAYRGHYMYDYIRNSLMH